MRFLIKNGTVVSDGRAVCADVLMDGGVIQAVGQGISAQADRCIDASGCFVMPGFIDTHTHFDLDLGVTVTADDFPTGTRAAVLGGTTTVLDFATQDKGMTMQQALDLWHRKAEGSSCNYGFHMAVSEWDDARIAEIDSMIAQGVTSFKMYMVYDTMRVSDGQIYDALRRTAAKDCVVGVHCENFDVLQQRIRDEKARGWLDPTAHPAARPNAVEAEGVARLMRIAELADAPAWIVHLSTQEGLEEARRARARGQEVYLETCPQYLTLTDECYAQPDGEKFIMSPPLRKKADNIALLYAMQADEIDVLGTDHCSFTMAQKALGGGDFSKVPNGGAGVENRAQLVYTVAVKPGYLSIVQMAEQMSTNAAKIFGMHPKKGCIREGSDADLVIFDPKAEETISYRSNAHNCDNSPYEGLHTTGLARDVFVGGKLVVEGRTLVQPGKGQYVSRGASQRPRRRAK